MSESMTPHSTPEPPQPAASHALNGKVSAGTALVPLPARAASASASHTQELTELGKLVASSGFFADARQAGQAAVKILAGRELGFGPIASMTGVYIVKGRVTLSANMMAAAIQKSGRFKFRVREHDEKHCVIDFFERDDASSPWEKIGTSAFSMEDAKTAGLGGDTYKKFPRNMLYARAMSNGAKWFAPQAFSGHTPYLPDEIPNTGYKLQADGEYIEAEVVSETPAPRVGEETLATLKALVAETGSDVGKITQHYGVDDVAELTQGNAEKAIELLEAKKQLTAGASASPGNKKAAK